MVTFKATLLYPWAASNMAGECRGYYAYGLRTVDYSCSVAPSLLMTCVFQEDSRNVCQVIIYRDGEVCGYAMWTKIV